jgi:hypothetical protein
LIEFRLLFLLSRSRGILLTPLPLPLPLVVLPWPFSAWLPTDESERVTVLLEAKDVS